MEKQTRKKKAEKGVRSQCPMSFRIDTENAEWLATKPNKGRTINEALKAKREAENTTNL